MRPLARLLLIGMILAFTAGSVVHATDMSGMNVGMASMTGGMAPGCNGCGDDDSDRMAENSCPDACMAQAIAILAATTAVPERVSQATGFRSSTPIIGRAGPPDPHPPKPILN